MSAYPEHEKMAAVAEDSQTIGEFLDVGLGRQGIFLCTVQITNSGYERLSLVSKPISEILADYFDIDLKKIEEEKRRMLEGLRGKERS